MIDHPGLQQLIREAVAEDLSFGDITTESIIARDQRAHAQIVTKQPCVLCGLSVAELVFKTLDSNIDVRLHAADGAQAPQGAIVLAASGYARAILSAERVALNFLQHLSGIATKTRSFVEVLERYRTRRLAVYRTDRDGAVTVTLGARTRVRGERWVHGHGPRLRRRQGRRGSRNDSGPRRRRRRPR